MKSIIKRIFGDTRGANMVEYIILVGVVAILVIGAFKTFNTKVKDKVGAEGDAVTNDITLK